MIDEPQEWYAMLDSCVHQLEGNVAEIEGLLERTQELEGQCNSVCEMCEEHSEWFVEAVNEHQNFVEDTVASLREHSREVLVQARELAEDQWLSLSEACTEVRDESTKWAQQQLEALTTSTLDDTQSALQKLCSDHRDRVVAMGEESLAEVKQLLSEHGQYVKDKIIQTFQEEMQKTGEAALERVKQEVLDAVVEGQLQTQVTSMLSPYLPQLMIAKAVAPMIARALEIARAGF